MVDDQLLASPISYFATCNLLHTDKWDNHSGPYHTLKFIEKYAGSSGGYRGVAIVSDESPSENRRVPQINLQSGVKRPSLYTSSQVRNSHLL